MSVAKQLYQLQETELELESHEQTLSQITSQLGESAALLSARDRLASDRKHLEELRKQQRSAEWEVDDLTSKIKAFEEQLYGGRIRNPKELTSLQHETELLKANRSRLEDKALELMEQIEQAEKSTTSSANELKRTEADWQSQQQKLSANLEQVKTKLTDLKQKREQLLAEIDALTLEVYHGLRKQKGTAVAKVEQGMCRGCRISLPVSELQQVRSGGLVRCGSCGRILYLV